MTKYIDISRKIFNGMKRYPSDPNVEIGVFKSIKNGNSCNLRKLVLGTHIGTHVDAPFHILNKGRTVDAIKINDLICDVIIANAGEVFSDKFFDSVGPGPARVRGVLFKGSGNQSALTIKEAKELKRHGMKVVGTENMSIEEMSDKRHPVHRYLLKNGIIIIEGLDLKSVKRGCYRLICLPLKIKNGDGAPARAVLAYD